MIRHGDEFARPTQRALRNTMEELCGVVRSADKLERTLDRIAEIAEGLTADLIVNVQADEPLIEPATIRAVIEPLVETEPPE